jgi:hypothetical protein
VNYVDNWRVDDDAAMGWLRYLGGAHSGEEMGKRMDVPARRAVTAMLRLVWRGRARMGPSCWVDGVPTSTWEATG